MEMALFENKLSRQILRLRILKPFWELNWWYSPSLTTLAAIELYELEHKIEPIRTNTI